MEELYGVDVSPDLISTVTDAVLEEVTEWQQRPLLPLYQVIVFDALRVRIRDEGTVRAKAVNLALGIAPDGTKDVLGLWIERTKSARFWLRVMTELKSRAVEDVLVAVVDGSKASPRRSPPSSLRRRCKPASCTCCATRSTSSPGSIVKRVYHGSQRAARQPVLFMLPATIGPAATSDSPRA